MESAKDLEKKLSEEAYSIIKNGFIYTDEALPILTSCLKIFDSFKKNRKYRSFIKKIKEYQLKNNISSVYWTEVQWLTDFNSSLETLRFPIRAACGQLELMPQDKKILSKHKLTTVKKFLDFCDTHGLGISIYEVNFQLSQVLTPITNQGVLKVASLADWCWLGNANTKIPVYYENSKIVQYYSIEHCLYFQKWDDDIPYSACTITMTKYRLQENLQVS